MMNLVSSIPTQPIPFEVPIGSLMIAALAVVVAIAVVDQARTFLAPGRAPRPALRPVASASH